MDFLGLEQRLVEHIRELIRCGKLTERRLARMTGISQPHIHNVLKGKRNLSFDTSDLILHVLHLDLADLLRERDEHSGPPGRM